MSKQSRHAKAAQPNGSSHSSDRGSTSSVGYGRPPAHTRFKPGQSGNPKGRQKGQRNVHTVLDETLNQRITIREGNRTRSLTKLDGVILTIVNGAVKGDTKAQAALMTMMRSVGMIGEAPEIADAQPFTANDEAVIEDFLRRQTPASPQTEAPTATRQSAPDETTPPGTEAKS
jgi:Family of unknown function (DUF5681)